MAGQHEYFANGVLVHNCYDALTYLFLAQEPHSAPATTYIPAGTHPGFIPGTFERRDRERSEAVEQREYLRTLEAMGMQSGGRYRRPS